MKRAEMLMLMLVFVLWHVLPAMADGNVRATMSSSGNLKITGDKRSNQIVVTNNGIGDIRVEGMSGTTVNGGNGGVDFAITTSNTLEGKLDIILKGGDNYVEIRDITVIKKMQLKCGHGDNTIGIFNATLVDDVSLNTGHGNDFIVLAGDTLIAEKLAIKTSGGDDSIEIAECASNYGKTIIKTNSGNDLINLQGYYLGRLALDTGKGIDELYISQYINVNRVKIFLGRDDDKILFASTANLTGTVTINGGKGDNDRIVQDDGLSTDFYLMSKFIENSAVETDADNEPAVITSQMVLDYTARGGDPLDISCPE
ncbi:exported hypothetical protein [uncultured Desulfobacterium sp.]|uniref:Auto-transporter adhesin head GIN domain-containing protein n=1 Tax=uncultured Desulfobacterium sp. TaxID=201089 RepID=A0A445MX02_9BACT|nr:exported hypothetical protein [uncultured Desulfobacterium sp.]